jgi:hypothetical protein
LAVVLDEQMIRSIDTSSESSQAAQSPATTVKPATTAGKSFKTVLDRQAQKLDAPDGETWAPVADSDNAAKITSGPRAGQYINLSHGDRRGQTFTIENRNGKTVHVYGTGEAQVVVESAQDATDGARMIHGKRYENGVKVPKGEQWAPVAGHDNYADILNGKRNGYFVNISGGVRDGMAFQIVKRGAKTYHVYGTGKHKQEIEVGVAKKPAASTPTAPGTTTGTTGSPSGTSQTGTSQTPSAEG